LGARPIAIDAELARDIAAQMKRPPSRRTKRSAPPGDRCDNVPVQRDPLGRRDPTAPLPAGRHLRLGVL
jgi:hypothetical protein